QSFGVPAEQAADRAQVPQRVALQAWVADLDEDRGRLLLMLGRLRVASQPAMERAEIHQLGTLAVAVTGPAVDGQRVPHMSHGFAVAAEALVDQAETGQGPGLPL